MTDLPLVKICGLTREVDLEHALEVGAEALGFVHHPPSPRHLEIESMARLVSAVPPTHLSVAVVVDLESDQALELVRASGVRALQLCGSEMHESFEDFPVPILRRVSVGPLAAAEIDVWRGIAWGFVLDHPSAPGGSGRNVDLGVARQLTREAPCLLAGGLDAFNVAECVTRARPLGVDASSRLEAAPGAKDPARVRAFVRATQAAFAALEDSA